MKSNTRIVNSALASVMLSACAANVGASIITSTQNGASGVNLFVINSSVATPSPGNPLGGSSAYPNTLYYNETFGPGNTAGGAIFFEAAAAATGYAVTLDVKNTGTQAWSGYSLYSGPGDISNPGYLNWFTFDLGYTPTISGGGGSASWASTPDNNWIVWSNLNVPVNSTITLEFNLDVIAGVSGGWEIQQLPQLVSVPEPCSMSLLALGIVGLIWRRCRG